MRMNVMIAAAFLSAACAAAMPSRADDLLDQQLGPPAPAEKALPAKPAEAPKPEAAPKSPLAGAPEMSNPDAAKTVDDQDLIRELTQPGGDKPDPQKVQDRMKAMLARMNDSAELLKKKEAGDLTQEMQRRIVMDLNVMIELAKQQQRTQPQQPGDGPPQPGQKRQPGNGQEGPKANEGGNAAATTDETSGGQDAAVTGDMRNRDPANWGGLPPRDRDEISHGATEEYLAAYRSMIDRYYQALAEMGKKRSR